MPLLVVDGLPFGVQLKGFSGADERLTAHTVWLADTFLTAERRSGGLASRA